MSVDQTIQVLLAISGFLLAFIMNQTNKRLEQITGVVGELKDGLSEVKQDRAVVVERINAHDQRLSRLERA